MNAITARLVPRSLVGLSATLALFGAGGCAHPCTPTTTIALDAPSVDLSTPDESSVLHAQLTSSGTGLANELITFTLLHGQKKLYSAQVHTDSRGDAALDLQADVSLRKTTGLIGADTFIATFAGRGTSCASSNTAKMHIVALG